MSATTIDGLRRAVVPGDRAHTANGRSSMDSLQSSEAAKNTTASERHDSLPSAASNAASPNSTARISPMPDTE